MAKAKAVIGPDTHPGFPGKCGPMDKIEMYGWEMVDRPGKYQKIHKSQLNVDHDYQRDNVRHARVNRIAHRWSWVQFGAISVARRPDGSFWVFDGQHRKLAADKRSDIGELPCMVFESTGPVDEAHYFLVINGDRGPVAKIDAYKALLAQGDATAMAVEEMIRASSYTMSRGGADRTVQCVTALFRAIKTDPRAARVAWQMAVRVTGGKTVVDRVFVSLFVVERHLAKTGAGSLGDDRFGQAIDRLNPKAIYRSIAQTVEYHGKGGEKIYGEALLRLLNKGRRNPIPSLYAESQDAGE